MKIVEILRTNLLSESLHVRRRREKKVSNIIVTDVSECVVVNSERRTCRCDWWCDSCICRWYSDTIIRADKPHILIYITYDWSNWIRSWSSSWHYQHNSFGSITYNHFIHEGSNEIRVHFLNTLINVGNSRNCDKEIKIGKIVLRISSNTPNFDISNLEIR